MTKEHILSEIRRTAISNGGTPLGQARFLTETGIRHSDWFGRYWARWNEAVLEAGFTPNALNSARTEEDILGRLCGLVREIQRFPVKGELRMKRKSDLSFPSDKTFERVGGKAKLIVALTEFASQQGYSDVVEICERSRSPFAANLKQGEGEPKPVCGYVYLMKHGSAREFKIGRTNNPIRREGEVGITLPQSLQPIHVIETDDPAGIELYWHRRFADKRLKGEWFALPPQDVRAFKRWCKIY